jgi:voltage-dependent calcium channel
MIAIIGFWISFGLATGGLERGQDHIGIFRALSVLRTARLLTITAGTTVREKNLRWLIVTHNPSNLDHHAFS